jgi:DNA anti-recombination protein RmuC
MNKDIEVWKQRNEILHKKVERMMEEAREKDIALANALAEDSRQKESDEKMMIKLERIQELEEINKEHQKLNGDLRREITALEQEKLELHVDNKKLAQQVDDQLDRARKAGM